MKFPKPVKRVKQRKPLGRTRLKRRQTRRVARKSPDEAGFLSWLHTQICCARGLTFVMGEPGNYRTPTHWCYAGEEYGEPVQAAHFRDHTGLGRKESDLTAIPLCREMHDDLDNRAPCFFKGWSLEARKDWHRLRQAEIQGRWRALPRSQGGE